MGVVRRSEGVTVGAYPIAMFTNAAAAQLRRPTDRPGQRETGGASVTRLTQVIAGPVADGTNATALYDAERLRSVLTELEAGRKFAALARANRGRIRRRDMWALEVSFSVELQDMSSRPVPMPPATATRQVRHLVIPSARGGRETFDAEDVRLAIAAVRALGRLFIQAQTGTVGRIMLKEFESALAAFDQRRTTTRV